MPVIDLERFEAAQLTFSAESARHLVSFRSIWRFVLSSRRLDSSDWRYRLTQINSLEKWERIETALPANGDLGRPSAAGLVQAETEWRTVSKPADENDTSRPGGRRLETCKLLFADRSRQRWLKDADMAATSMRATPAKWWSCQTDYTKTCQTNTLKCDYMIIMFS